MKKCQDFSNRQSSIRRGFGRVLKMIPLISVVLTTVLAPISSQAKESATFGNEYDPSITRFESIESGEAYTGVPKPLEIENQSTYAQPWSGYCPESKLENAKLYPCQTSNIKVGGVYRGIEVKGNKWMSMASDEARESVEHGGGPFGAVIVQVDDESGKVIRYWRNHNHVTEWVDPTAHAEVTTIRAVCRELGVLDLSKISKDDPKLKLPQEGKTSHCEIYSSAEPCPMCYAAIRWARLNTLVFAATRFDAATQGCNFSDDAIYVELATPYLDRGKLGMNVYQSSVPNSLDAFNGFKRLGSAKY